MLCRSRALLAPALAGASPIFRDELSGWLDVRYSEGGLTACHFTRIPRRFGLPIMGLYDRDYYRDEQPRGFQLGLGQSVVVNLVVINIAIYLVDVLLQIGLSFRPDGQPGILALQADLAQRTWYFWQLLTCGFAHSSEPWHVLFNMLALWFFGRDVEGIYGRKEFTQLYLSLVVCSSLVWLVATNIAHPGSQHWAVGASGAVSGIFTVFVFHFPKRTIYLNFLIPVPAWALGILWLVKDISGAMGHGESGVAYSAHLGGAAFGLLFYKTRFQLGRLIPQHFSLPKLGRKPPLRVHRPEQREASLMEQADAVLEKIGRTGQESLTKNERRILEDYSRKMQQKRR